MRAGGAGGAATRHDRGQRDRRRAGRRSRRGCRLDNNHGRWRSDECRNDNGLGRRQEVAFPRRWWRRQHDEFARPRRQEKNRRRRGRLIVASPKRHHGPINNNQFLRRRRRHTEINESEIGRTFKLGADHGQAPPGIPYMRTVRIAPQIRPISRRCVIEHAAPPDDLLAANRDHGGDASRVAASRMERQELLVAIDRIERERGGIRVFNARIAAHRFFAQVDHRCDIRRRRRVRRTFGEKERGVDLRCIPGDFATVGHFTHAQPNPREHIVQRESAGRDHFGKRRRVRAIRAGLLRPDRPRSGIERDRHAWRRIDQRKTARQRLAALRERTLPGRVENDDFHTGRQRCQRLSKI